MRKRDEFFGRLLFISAVLVIALVTVVAGAVYTYSSSKIKSSMSEVSIKLLNQVEVFTDTYIFRKAEVFAAQNFISVKPGSETDRLYGTEPLGTRFMYDYYTNLSAMVDAEDFVENVHIYLPHRNMIMSSEGISYLDDESKYTRSTAEKKQIFEQGMSGRKWINTYRNSNGINVMTFILRYSPYADVIPKAMIAVDINEESLQSAFKNIENDDEARIEIIDEMGNIISTSNKALLYEDISDEKYIKKIIESDDETGYFVSKIDGEKKLVSYFKSEYNNWNYISTRNIDVVYMNTRVILIFTLIIYLLAVLIGILGVYFVSKSYYMPIHNLANFVGVLTGKGRVGDAYSFLSDAIYQLGDDIKQYKKLASDVLPIARSNFAYEIIHNKNISDEYLKKHYEIIGMTGEYRAFAVISCKFIETEVDNDAYFKYSFIEYLNSLNNDNTTVLCLNEAQSLIVVICSKNERTLGIQTFLNDTKKLLSQQDMNLHLYVGNVAYDINDVSRIYERLHEMQKYSFIYSGFKVFYLKELEMSEKNVSTLDCETLFKELEKSIDNRDENETLLCISQIVNTLKNGSFSYDYVQQFLMRLLNFVSNYMKERNIETDDIVKEKESLYDIYKTADTLDQIMGFIQNVCLNIIYKNNDEEKEYEISTRIKEFINSLPDEEMKNVTLMYVADNLMLSQAYISRMFKNETGERFIDYLTNNKLERCAEILKDKSVKIKDVCDMMGYSNSNYFIRKFREKYGITPKQYQFRT